MWYTNCPVVSASNVDEALGWTREEFKKIGVKYAYFRSVRENDWYPHYIHNLDNLIRVGGLFPPVHVACRHPPDPAAGGDAMSTKAAACWCARETTIYRMSRSQRQEDRPVEEPQHAQERLVARHRGAGHRADAAAERHDARRRRDRRVSVPGRLVRRSQDAGAASRTRPSCGSRATTSTTSRCARWKAALEKGVVDAIYTQSKYFQHLQEATGKFKAIEDLSRYPDWTPAVVQSARRLHLFRRDGRAAPRTRRRVPEGR